VAVQGKQLCAANDGRKNKPPKSVRFIFLLVFLERIRKRTLRSKRRRRARRLAHGNAVGKRISIPERRRRDTDSLPPSA
jgi:hypothetical protein